MPDDYIKGEGRVIHRNPLLARIMYYSKDIESFGTGLKRIADTCKEADVRFEFRSDNYGFTVIFYRPPLWTSDNIEDNITGGGGDRVGDNVGDKINGIQRKIVDLMLNESTISTRIIAAQLVSYGHTWPIKNKIFIQYFSWSEKLPAF
jgi:predicted HTH transcriptional regulator